MLTASQAKAVAQKYNPNHDFTDFDWVMDIITKCSKQGKYDYDYRSTLPKGTINKLRRLGYSVRKHWVSGAFYYFISWE